MIKLKGSTGKTSRVLRDNLVMEGVIALHASLHYLQPIMSPEQFGYTSVVLGVIVAMWNKYLRTKTTGPLHNGNQL